MGLTVYVMRHGRAEPGAGRPDEQRRLSPDGARGMGFAAQGLRAVGLTVDTILSSPLIRAYQTAEAVQRVVAPGLQIRQSNALGPETDPPAVVRELQALQNCHAVLVVGHLPGIAGLLRTLVMGEEGGGFTFEPATVARVDFGGAVRPGCGQLRWLLCAQHLESLGGAVY